MLQRTGGKVIASSCPDVLKKMKKILAIAVIGAGLVTAAPAFATTNLVANGDFENGISVFTSGYYNVGPGGSGADHSVPTDFGWTVSEGNVDYIAYNGYGPAPIGGGSYGLDLVGYGSTGEISQTLTTAVGQVYDVSFHSKAHPGISGPTAAVNGADLSGTVTGGTEWQTFTGSFTATGTSTDFSLAEIYGGSNGGVFLDNISVSAAPEPATWISMIFGFGLLGFMLRNRKGGVASIA